MLISINDVRRNLTYTGYFLNPSDVSCTDMGRKVGGTRKKAGAGNTSTSGSTTSGSTTSGSTTSGGQGQARGERGSNNQQSSTPSYEATPSELGSQVGLTGESSFVSQQESFASTNQDTGGYDPSSGYTGDVNLQGIYLYGVSPDDAQQAQVTAQKSIYQKMQEAKERENLRLQGLQQQQQSGADTSSLQGQTLSNLLSQPDLSSTGMERMGRPDRDNVFGIGDSTYKTEAQQDFSDWTSSTMEGLGFDFGTPTVAQQTQYQETQSDFWGGDASSTQQEPAIQEADIQVLLAKMHIQTANTTIMQIQTQLTELKNEQENERANMIASKGTDFASYNESVLRGTSSKYLSITDKIARLERELEGQEAYVSSEEAKLKKWEGEDLTSLTGEAFTGGIRFENPMDKPADITTPAKTETMEYVEAEPNIGDVVQAPDFSKRQVKEGTGEGLSAYATSISVFSDLQAPFEYQEAGGEMAVPPSIVDPTKATTGTSAEVGWANLGLGEGGDVKDVYTIPVGKDYDDLMAANEGKTFNLMDISGTTEPTDGKVDLSSSDWKDYYQDWKADKRTGELRQWGMVDVPMSADPTGTGKLWAPTGVTLDPNQVVTVDTYNPDTKKYDIEKKVAVKDMTAIQLSNYQTKVQKASEVRAQALDTGYADLALKALESKDGDGKPTMMDFHKLAGETGMETYDTVEGYNQFLTDRGVDEAMFFSPTPRDTSVFDVRGIFEKAQETSGGMIVESVDFETGKPTYAEYTYSWTEPSTGTVIQDAPEGTQVQTSGGWEHKTVPITLATTETRMVLQDGKYVEKEVPVGQQLQERAIIKAEQEFDKAYQKERSDNLLFGKYSMSEWIAATSAIGVGDAALTTTFMEERGLSMDAPVGSMSLTGGRIQPSEKVEERLYDTYINEGMSQAQAKQLAGSDWETRTHMVTKRLTPAEGLSVTTTSAYTDVNLEGVPDYLKETTIGAESPYIRKEFQVDEDGRVISGREAYDDPAGFYMKETGAGAPYGGRPESPMMEQSDHWTRTGGIYKQQQLDYFQDVASSYITEFPQVGAEPKMWTVTWAPIYDEAPDQPAMTTVAASDMRGEIREQLEAGQRPVFFETEGMGMRIAPNKIGEFQDLQAEINKLPDSSQDFRPDEEFIAEHGDIIGTPQDRAFWLERTTDPVTNESKPSWTAEAQRHMQDTGMIVTLSEHDRQYDSLPTDHPYHITLLADAIYASSNDAGMLDLQKLETDYPKEYQLYQLEFPEQFEGTPPIVIGSSGTPAIVPVGATPTFGVQAVGEPSFAAGVWTEIFAPTIRAIDSEIVKFWNAPLSYVFKTGFQYNERGQDALKSGLLLPHEVQRGTTIGYGAPTYRELYAMDYGKPVSEMDMTEKFVHSQKMYWSNFLAPAVSIGRVAGIAEYVGSGFDEKSMLMDTSRERQLLRMGATGMSEEDAYGLPKYAIYEPTFLEAGLGSVIEKIQHEIDKGDSIIPNWTGSVEGGDLEWGSEKVWQEGEHVARPFFTKDEKGTWDEMKRDFGVGGSTGIHGAIAQAPLEIAMMIVPINWAKPALMAATVAGANVMRAVALRSVPRTMEALAQLRFGKALVDLSSKPMTHWAIAQLKYGMSYNAVGKLKGGAAKQKEILELRDNAAREVSAAKTPADEVAIEQAKMWRSEKEYINMLAAQQHYTTRAMGMPVQTSRMQYAKSKSAYGLQKPKIDKSKPLGEKTVWEMSDEVPTDMRLFGRVKPLFGKGISSRVKKISEWDFDPTNPLSIQAKLKQSWFWRDRSYQAGALLHRSKLDIAITNLYRGLPVGVRKQLERVPRRMTQRDRLNKMLDDMFRSAKDRYGKQGVKLTDAQAKDKVAYDFAESMGKTEAWGIKADKARGAFKKFEAAQKKAEADNIPLITILEDVTSMRTPIGQSGMSIRTMPFRARNEMRITSDDGTEFFISKGGRMRQVYPDDTEGAMVNIPLGGTGGAVAGSKELESLVTLERILQRDTIAGESYGVLKPSQLAAEKLSPTGTGRAGAVDKVFGFEVKISYDGFDVSKVELPIISDSFKVIKPVVTTPDGAMPFGMGSFTQLYTTAPTLGVKRVATSPTKVLEGVFKQPEKIKSAKLDALHKKLDKLDREIDGQQPPPSTVGLEAFDIRRIKELEAEIANAQARTWGDATNKASFIKTAQDEIIAIRAKRPEVFVKETKATTKLIAERKAIQKEIKDIEEGEAFTFGEGVGKEFEMRQMEQIIPRTVEEQVTGSLGIQGLVSKPSMKAVQFDLASGMGRMFDDAPTTTTKTIKPLKIVDEPFPKGFVLEPSYSPMGELLTGAVGGKSYIPTLVRPAAVQDAYGKGVGTGMAQTTSPAFGLRKTYSTATYAVTGAGAVKLFAPSFGKTSPAMRFSKKVWYNAEAVRQFIQNPKFVGGGRKAMFSHETSSGIVALGGKDFKITFAKGLSKKRAIEDYQKVYEDPMTFTTSAADRLGIQISNAERQIKFHTKAIDDMKGTQPSKPKGMEKRDKGAWRKYEAWQSEMDNHKLRLKAEKENLKNATEQRGTVMVDDVQPSIVIPKNLGGTMPSRGTVGRDSGIGYMIDNMTRIERRLNIMPWGRGAEFESAVTAREVSGGFSIESQVREMFGGRNYMTHYDDLLEGSSPFFKGQSFEQSYYAVGQRPAVKAFEGIQKAWNTKNVELRKLRSKNYVSPKEQARMEKLQNDIVELEALHVQFVGRKVESVETGIDILAQVIRAPAKGGRGGTVFGFELSSGAWKKPSELQGEKVIAATGRIEDDLGTGKFYPTPDYSERIVAEGKNMGDNAQIFTGKSPEGTFKLKEIDEVDETVGIGKKSPEEYGSMYKEQGSVFEEYGHMMLFEEKVGKFWKKPQARMEIIKYDMGSKPDEQAAKMLMDEDQFFEYYRAGMWKPEGADEGLLVDIPKTKAALARGEQMEIGGRRHYSLWIKGEKLDEAMREIFVGARETEIGWLLKGQQPQGKNSLERITDAYLAAQQRDPSDPFSVMKMFGDDIDEELLMKSFRSGNHSVLAFDDKLDDAISKQEHLVHNMDMGKNRVAAEKDLTDLKEQRMIMYDDFWRSDWMMRALEGTDLGESYMKGVLIKEADITRAIEVKAKEDGAGSMAETFQKQWQLKEYSGHRLDYTPAQLKKINMEVMSDFYKFNPLVRKTTFRMPAQEVRKESAGRVSYRIMDDVEREATFEEVVRTGTKYYSPTDAGQILNKGVMPEVDRMAHFHGDLLSGARSYQRQWATYKGQTFWDAKSGQRITKGRGDWEYSTKVQQEVPYHPTRQQVIDTAKNKDGDYVFGGKGTKYADLNKTQRNDLDEIMSTWNATRSDVVRQEISKAKKGKAGQNYRVVDKDGNTVFNPEQKEHWDQGWKETWNRRDVSKVTGGRAPDISPMLLTPNQMKVYKRWLTKMNLMGGRKDSVKTVRENLLDLQYDVRNIRKDVDAARDNVVTRQIESEMASVVGRTQRAFLEDADNIGIDGSYQALYHYWGRFQMKAGDKSKYTLARSKVQNAEKSKSENLLRRSEIQEDIRKIDLEARTHYDTVTYVKKYPNGNIVFEEVKVFGETDKKLMPALAHMSVKPQKVKGGYELDPDFIGREGYDNVVKLDDFGQPIFLKDKVRTPTGEAEGFGATYRASFVEETVDNPAYPKYIAVLDRKKGLDLELKGFEDEIRLADANISQGKSDMQFLKDSKKGKYDPEIMSREKVDILSNYKTLDEISLSMKNLRTADGRSGGQYHYVDLDAASVKKVRDRQTAQHKNVDMEYKNLLTQQQNTIFGLLKRAGDRDFMRRSPTDPNVMESSSEAIRHLIGTPILEGITPFGYIPKAYQKITKGRPAYNPQQVDSMLEKASGKSAKEGFYNVVSKLFSTDEDKKAFIGVVLSEMYHAKGMLKGTSKKIQVEEFTIKDLKKRLKEVEAANFKNADGMKPDNMFQTKARLEDDIEYHERLLSGDAEAYKEGQTVGGLKSTEMYYINQIDEASKQIKELKGWVPEGGTTSQIKATNMVVDTAKHLDWAKKSLVSKEQKLVDANEKMKSLTNEIALWTEKNQVRIDPKGSGYIGVDSSKRAQQLFSGLGDTTFIGQYVRQSQKATMQDWSKTIEWFVSDTKGKGRQMLPAVSTGRLYKTNVFQVSTGYVPVFGSVRKPIAKGLNEFMSRGGLLNRLYEHVFKTPLQEPIGIGKTVKVGGKIKERVWDEDSGDWVLKDVVKTQGTGKVSKWALSRDETPFVMTEGHIDFAAQVLIRTKVKEDFLRRLWQDIHPKMTKEQRMKIIRERIKDKDDGSELGWDLVEAGQKNVMYHHVREAEQVLAQAWGVKHVSLKPYAERMVESLRRDKNTTKGWMESDFAKYEATIGGERGFSIREKIGMAIANRKEVKAVMGYSARAREVLEIQRQKMFDADQMVYGRGSGYESIRTGKEQGAYANFVDLWNKNLRLNEKEIALGKNQTELNKANDIIDKYRSNRVVDVETEKLDRMGNPIPDRTKPVRDTVVADREITVMDDWNRGIDKYPDINDWGSQRMIFDMSGQKYKIGAVIPKGKTYQVASYTKPFQEGGRPRYYNKMEMQPMNKKLVESDLETGNVVGWESMSDEMKVSLKQAFDRRRELEGQVKEAKPDIANLKQLIKAKRRELEDQKMLHSNQMDDFLIKFFEQTETAKHLRKSFLNNLTKNEKMKKGYSKLWDKLEDAAEGQPSGASREQMMLQQMKEARAKEGLLGGEKPSAKESITALQRKYIQAEMSQYGYSDPNLYWYYTKLRYPVTAPPWTRSEWADKDVPELLPQAHGEEQSSMSAGASAEPEVGGDGSMIPAGGDFQEISNIETPVDINIIAQNISDITGQFQAPNLVSGVRSALYTPQRMGQSGKIDLDSILREGVKQQHRQDSVQIPSLHPVTQETFERFPIFPRRFPPAAFMPLFPFFPDYRRRPKRSRMVKRPKRKIWWDVPEQPLGEPWAATEYRVFGTAGQAGEPAYVQKKEDKKKLDGTPFGIPIDQDVNFWTQHPQDRGGFTMRRQVAKDSQGRTVKDKKGKKVRYKGQKEPWKRQRGWTMPDSE